MIRSCQRVSLPVLRRGASVRSFHPALWAAIALKKVAVMQIAHQYGIPRVYKRLLELDRKVATQTPERKAYVRGILQKLIRLPNQTVSALEGQTGVLTLLSEFEKTIRAQPTLISSVAMTFLKQTPIVSMVKDFQ